MDQPQTRREMKKGAKEKAQGKSVYSAKHIRHVESLREKASNKHIGMHVSK